MQTVGYNLMFLKRRLIYPPGFISGQFKHQTLKLRVVAQ